MASRPQLNFLLRASAALIALSAIWWFLLLGPLFVAFRQTAELLGGLLFGRSTCSLIRETISGGWDFCVPAASANVRSIEFEMPRSDLYIFTFGLPVYWAILLAAPPKSRRTQVRVLVLGTVLTGLLEVGAFLVFLKTYAFAVVAQSQPITGLTQWLVEFSQYLELNVAPDLSPFVAALVLLRDLRVQILGWTKVTIAARVPAGKAMVRRR